MRRSAVAFLAACGGAAAGRWVFDRLVSGQLTVDLGWKRTVRRLGPLTTEIDAPMDSVFDVIAEPYLERTTHAMTEKLRVVERGSDLVLAEHYTPIGRRRAVTLETVGFERPYRITFRLVRGPVPSVVESFALSDVGGATRLHYEGELGTDGGRLGALWGDLVATQWEKAVRAALAGVKEEAERRQHRQSTPAVPRARPAGTGE